MCKGLVYPLRQLRGGVKYSNMNHGLLHAWKNWLGYWPSSLSNIFGIFRNTKFSQQSDTEAKSISWAPFQAEDLLLPADRMRKAPGCLDGYILTPPKSLYCTFFLVHFQTAVYLSSKIYYLTSMTPIHLAMRKEKDASFFLHWLTQTLRIGVSL